MRIKIHGKVPGIPNARVTYGAGDELGSATAVLFIHQVDAYGFSSVCASLRLSPDESRDVAAHLIRMADEAERLNKAG